MNIPAFSQNLSVLSACQSKLEKLSTGFSAAVSAARAQAEAAISANKALPEQVANEGTMAGEKTIDFHNTSTRELWDWANTEYHAGRLSYEELTSVCQSGFYGDIDFRFDLFQDARDSLAAGRTYFSEEHLKELRTALVLINKWQGTAYTVDPRWKINTHA
ncbi:MAG: hypothetical protein LBL69_03520 [Zoogloeaceae bacterium]|jgi:hypothetical protein|nr:hypothetical protein [Zoogloeaceae bacterium]